FGVDAGAVLVDDRHPNLAVVEQQGMAQFHGLEDLRMRQAYALRTALDLAAVEAERRTLAQRDAFAGDIADAKLGALQIAEDADGAAEMGLRRAHRGGDLFQGVEGEGPNFKRKTAAAGFKRALILLGAFDGRSKVATIFARLLRLILVTSPFAGIGQAYRPVLGFLRIHLK